jgi:hypothetical protein
MTMVCYPASHSASYGPDERAKAETWRQHGELLMLRESRHAVLVDSPTMSSNDELPSGRALDILRMVSRNKVLLISSTARVSPARNAIGARSVVGCKSASVGSDCMADILEG